MTCSQLSTSFLSNCQEHGLKLHASKCVLLATTVRYCGRLITKDGVHFDPKNIEALQIMREPQNGAEMVQFVAAVNWMRSVIPQCSKRVAPLQAAIAKVFEGKCRGTKKAAAAVSLLHLWGPEEQAAFKYLQAAIMESMTLAFQDPEKRICVLTDASDRFYAGLCYALLRMRPLSISCAEGFVAISCGNVDYDKSGWRDD
jgi:hypothetical protein